MNRFIDDLVRRYPSLEGLADKINNAAKMIINALQAGNTLYMCGNGGSASDAEHIAGELLKGFCSKRPMDSGMKHEFAAMGECGAELAEKLQCGLRAVSLVSHPAFLTAFANDVDASMIFAQQLFALGSKGDVVIGLTTSGNSENIYKCFTTARVMGIKTILLTGASGGKCSELADCIINVPENETFKIQEYHLPVYHTLCLMIEDSFYGKK
jgi:D-sedoheptulose 7-phosphate isomerase